MMRFDLVGVPYTSMAAEGGIARAIDVLRSAGLAARLERVGDVADAGDLSVQRGDGARGESGLLNERALGRLVAAVREAVAASHRRHRLPLLVGADCPVLLGALQAIPDRDGDCGLLLVDGHEDAWPPPLSPTGEASDSEVGIALGLADGPLPEPLRDLVPLLRVDQLAMLGPRDRGDISAAGLASLDGHVALFRDDAATRETGPRAAAQAAAARLRMSASAFWLHLDLDVLATEELAAVDYRQPGGLTWDELRELAVQALAERGCAGVSIAIYNPDLDPGRAGAELIARFAAELVAGAAGVKPRKPG